jgi:hypothetical protein
METEVAIVSLEAVEPAKGSSWSSTLSDSIALTAFLENCVTMTQPQLKLFKNTGRWEMKSSEHDVKLVNVQRFDM